MAGLREAAVRVLVVDDEVRLADALQRGLQAEGFAVDVAHDGEQGLHLATERDYDLVVLDVMLPKLNGYRVCQRLRAAGNWVPVLMLSAKDGEYDQAEGLDVGADDYLVKPFSYVVLVARLRALARRGAPQGLHRLPAQEDRRTVRSARRADRARGRLPTGRDGWLRIRGDVCAAGGGGAPCAPASPCSPRWWSRSDCWPARFCCCSA